MLTAALASLKHQLATRRRRSIGYVAKLVAGFTESYQGAYENVEDWAEQHLEDTGLLQQVPESLRGHLDIESWADDAELNGDVFAVEFEGKLHVFSNR
jgi:antirestriction protein